MLPGKLALKDSMMVGAAIAGDSYPFVSVIVPVRNEEQVLKQCLLSLVGQSYPDHRLEILVIDGRSSDRSREIVQDLMKESHNLRLYDNAKENTPAGMNVGVRAAKGSIIVIAGAHAVYPQTYVQQCVTFLARTGADVVGGPVRTESIADSIGGQLACAILSNGFGVGNSRFRTDGPEGLVDTVPFGAYRRDVFDDIGLFNETLVRNQDNDLSARVRKAGRKIYFSPILTAVYLTSDSYIDLLRQTFRKTQWHIVTLRENRRAFGYRHVAPAAFVVALAILGFLWPGHSLARLCCLSLLGLYLGIGWMYSIYSSKRHSKFVKAILPLACFPFHLAYGLGTIVGVRHLVSACDQPYRPDVPTDRFES